MAGLQTSGLSSALVTSLVLLALLSQSCHGNGCGTCGQGEGVAKKCTDSSQTVCAPCVNGKTYSSEVNADLECETCTGCGEDAHQISPCNATHNTLCECDRNYYFDQIEQKCKACTLCPIGHGALKTCSKIHNTRCQKCRNGTFSDHRSNLGCRVCRKCSAEQLVLRSCSVTENTVCVDVPGRIVRSTPIYSTDPSTSPESSGSDGSNGMNIIPIYCAILVAVILGLVLYVAVIHWRRRVAKQKAKAIGLLPDGAHGGPGDLPISKQGSDSGVCMDQEARQISGNTKLRDLPMSKRKAIENHMSHCPDEEGGWRHLARELGYNNCRISTFVTRADQECISPIRYLLLEWGKGDHATVGAFCRALKNIDREDVTHVLQINTRELQGHGVRDLRDLQGNREPLLL